MNTCHPCILIHGNPVRLYHPWEPCAASLFFELEPIDNSLCWVFFPRSSYGLYWACLVRCTLVWAPSTRTPVSAPTAKGTTCSRSICERNFFITLPPCCTPPLWALIPFVREITPWGAFNWEVNIAHRDTTLPKSLNLRVWAQLCYMNSSTSLLLLHVGLPLTRVYPTFSTSWTLSHSLLWAKYVSWLAF